VPKKAKLRFLIFTVCRTNEVIGARWDEIDRSQAVWKIPAERMKMDEDHNVPLTDTVLAILDQMRDGSQSEIDLSSRRR
jgi:integrase